MDAATVARMARLSRIRLSDQEAEGLAADLGQILDWVEQLNEVNTDGVDPMTSGLGTGARMRPDGVTEIDRTEEVLANAPARGDDFFVVPKVVE